DGSAGVGASADSSAAEGSAGDGASRAGRSGASRPAGRPLWRRAAGAWLPPLVALAAGWSLLAYRSPYHGRALFRPSSWGRWDTGHYMQIATHGYYATWQCTKGQLPPHLPPGRWLCGSVGWFPGYPAALRGLSEITGIALPVAGLVVAWACWYA